MRRIYEGYATLNFEWHWESEGLFQTRNASFNTQNVRDFEDSGFIRIER